MLLLGSNLLEARNCQEIRCRDPTRVLKLIQFAPNRSVCYWESLISWEVR